jgi:hypothetical protein
MSDFILTFQHRAPLPLAQPINLLYENFDGSIIEGIISMTEIAVGTDGQLYFTAGKSGDADHRVFRADRCVEITFLANGTKVSGASGCADALSRLAQSALSANLNTSAQDFGTKIGAMIGGLLIAAIVYFVFMRS